jgi:GNAT superfamily N-acetyltransferase
MDIAYLADYPGHVSTVAGWIYREWGHLSPDCTLEQVEASIRAHMNRDELPLALIALSGATLTGTASLRTHDMSTRTDLSPWLASVYVLPEYRGRGIGSELVRAVEREGKGLRVARLYLYTPDRESFYARLGWSVLERTEYRGQSVVIMAKDL